mmetsp:Transcript_43904/g.48876  ORF Transcript_43904/g.48876 Transcript_43904/m.48876 type:complete len:90 (+) Transcript_43904:533-802(+)
MKTRIKYRSVFMNRSSPSIEWKNVDGPFCSHIIVAIVKVLEMNTSHIRIGAVPPGNMPAKKRPTKSSIVLFLQNYYPTKRTTNKQTAEM